MISITVCGLDRPRRVATGSGLDSMFRKGERGMVVPFRRSNATRDRAREAAWGAVSMRVRRLMAGAPDVFDWLVRAVRLLLDDAERRLSRGSR